MQLLALKSLAMEVCTPVKSVTSFCGGWGGGCGSSDSPRNTVLFSFWTALSLRAVITPRHSWPGLGIRNNRWIILWWYATHILCSNLLPSANDQQYSIQSSLSNVPKPWASRTKTWHEICMLLICVSKVMISTGLLEMRERILVTCTPWKLLVHNYRVTNPQKLDHLWPIPDGNIPAWKGRDAFARAIKFLESGHFILGTFDYLIWRPCQLSASFFWVFFEFFFSFSDTEAEFALQEDMIAHVCRSASAYCYNMVFASGQEVYLSTFIPDPGESNRLALDLVRAILASYLSQNTGSPTFSTGIALIPSEMAL